MTDSSPVQATASECANRMARRIGNESLNDSGQEDTSSYYRRASGSQTVTSLTTKKTDHLGRESDLACRGNRVTQENGMSTTCSVQASVHSTEGYDSDDSSVVVVSSYEGDDDDILVLWDARELNSSKYCGETRSIVKEDANCGPAFHGVSATKYSDGVHQIGSDTTHRPKHKRPFGVENIRRGVKRQHAISDHLDANQLNSDERVSSGLHQISNQYMDRSRLQVPNLREEANNMPPISENLGATRNCEYNCTGITEFNCTSQHCKCRRRVSNAEEGADSGHTIRDNVASTLEYNDCNPSCQPGKYIPRADMDGGQPRVANLGNGNNSGSTMSECSQEIENARNSPSPILRCRRRKNINRRQRRVAKLQDSAKSGPSMSECSRANQGHPESQSPILKCLSRANMDKGQGRVANLGNSNNGGPTMSECCHESAKCHCNHPTLPSLKHMPRPNGDKWQSGVADFRKGANRGPTMRGWSREDFHPHSCSTANSGPTKSDCFHENWYYPGNNPPNPPLNHMPRQNVNVWQPGGTTLREGANIGPTLSECFQGRQYCHGSNPSNPPTCIPRPNVGIEQRRIANVRDGTNSATSMRCSVSERVECDDSNLSTSAHNCMASPGVDSLLSRVMQLQPLANSGPTGNFNSTSQITFDQRLSSVLITMARHMDSCLSKLAEIEEMVRSGLASREHVHTTQQVTDDSSRNPEFTHISQQYRWYQRVDNIENPCSSQDILPGLRDRANSGPAMMDNVGLVLPDGSRDEVNKTSGQMVKRRRSQHIIGNEEEIYNVPSTSDMVDDSPLIGETPPEGLNFCHSSSCGRSEVRANCGPTIHESIVAGLPANIEQIAIHEDDKVGLPLPCGDEHRASREPDVNVTHAAVPLGDVLVAIREDDIADVIEAALPDELITVREDDNTDRVGLALASGDEPDIDITDVAVPLGDVQVAIREDDVADDVDAALPDELITVREDDNTDRVGLALASGDEPDIDITDVAVPLGDVQVAIREDDMADDVDAALPDELITVHEDDNTDRVGLALASGGEHSASDEPDIDITDVAVPLGDVLVAIREDDIADVIEAALPDELITVREDDNTDRVGLALASGDEPDIDITDVAVPLGDVQVAIREDDITDVIEAALPDELITVHEDDNTDRVGLALASGDEHSASDEPESDNVDVAMPFDDEHSAYMEPYIVYVLDMAFRSCDENTANHEPTMTGNAVVALHSSVEQRAKPESVVIDLVDLTLTDADEQATTSESTIDCADVAMPVRNEQTTNQEFAVSNSVDVALPHSVEQMDNQEGTVIISVDVGLPGGDEKSANCAPAIRDSVDVAVLCGDEQRDDLDPPVIDNVDLVLPGAIEQTTIQEPDVSNYADIALPHSVEQSTDIEHSNVHIVDVALPHSVEQSTNIEYSSIHIVDVALACSHEQMDIREHAIFDSVDVVLPDAAVVEQATIQKPDVSNSVDIALPHSVEQMDNQEGTVIVIVDVGLLGGDEKSANCAPAIRDSVEVAVLCGDEQRDDLDPPMIDNVDLVLPGAIEQTTIQEPDVSNYVDIALPHSVEQSTDIEHSNVHIVDVALPHSVEQMDIREHAIVDSVDLAMPSAGEQLTTSEPTIDSADIALSGGNDQSASYEPSMMDIVDVALPTGDEVQISATDSQIGEVHRSQRVLANADKTANGVPSSFDKVGELLVRNEPAGSETICRRSRRSCLQNGYPGCKNDDFYWYNNWPTKAVTKRRRTNLHRNDIYEDDSLNKPVQSGTPVFIEELRSRHFPSADDIIKVMGGQQVTVQNLERNGFNDPILVSDKEGLGMVVPSETFSVSDVEYYVGADRRVDVIDVTNQAGIRMKLGEFINYFKSTRRTKVLNLISLEFTGTLLSTLVEAPFVARKLDWLNQVWPADAGGDESLVKPQVEKYCLISVKDSYTDFHVDFGGTSVWYHLLWGEKIFYLIKPTPANISLYQRWNSSTTQSETFFGDQVDMCYKCTLRQGETLIIPTGWIHAVLTPVDSLVFGGNFLHSLNIPLQLQVHEIEQGMKIAKKYLYPSFQKVNWFAARSLLEELKKVNDSGGKCPSYLLHGLKALVVALKQWTQEKDLNKAGKEEIPADIDAQKLLKDLSKEIRHAERYLMSLNPPKPERESKRKKKKPSNDDFVDISQPISIAGIEEFLEKSPLKVSVRSPGKRKDLSSQQTREKAKSPIKLTLTKPPAQSSEPGVAVSYTVTPKGKKGSLAILSEKQESQQKQPSVPFEESLENKIKQRAKRPKLKSNVSLVKCREKSLTRKKSEYNTENSSPNFSVYDFHDDSDGDTLMIDENPNRLRRTGENMPQKYKSNIYVVNGVVDHLPDMEVAGEVDVVSDTPKNGIEELLKASVFTSDTAKENSAEEESEMEEGEVDIVSSSSSQEPVNMRDDSPSGDNSAATRDAIAGMLSFSRALDTKAQTPCENTASKSKAEVSNMSSSDDDEEQINNVHQDEDFIYPTLDLSDDEDENIRARITSKKLDEAWSPRARVGPVTPKTNRPVREGKKRTAVEKGLEAAAAKRANLPAPKRQYLKKKVKKAAESKTSTPPAESLAKPPSMKSPKKPKKGMATAKQRLGKILKIHKMIGP